MSATIYSVETWLLDGTVYFCVPAKSCAAAERHVRSLLARDGIQARLFIGRVWASLPIELIHPHMSLMDEPIQGRLL